MKLLQVLALLAALSSACASGAGESERTTGPHGLVGWKTSHVLENGNEVSETLSIARHGKLIRKIHGDPFVWRWMFRNDGKSLAYESGPLHFSMICVQVDVATGKEIDRVDCFHYPEEPPPSGWPPWLIELQNSP